jgi:taurine dioxygenase
LEKEAAMCQLRIESLPQGFGAEVSGFDVQGGRDPADIGTLQRAYDEHQLLVFRDGGRIAPERQVEFTGWFGQLVSNGSAGYCTVLHNDEMAGSARLPFHCDLSYTECPIKGISLHALAVPPGGTSTTFVSNVTAWEALPEATKRDLRYATVRHFLGARPIYGWPDFIADHPLRLEHPRTGHDLLFVTEHHATRILELDETRSAAVLADLFAHLYTPERRYEHQWRVGDLLIWDNLAVQHARTRPSNPAEGERAMQRVALSEIGLDELVQRARAKQAA